VRIAFVEAAPDLGGSQLSTLDLVHQLNHEQDLDIYLVVQAGTAIWHEARLRGLSDNIIELPGGPFLGWRRVLWLLKYQWRVWQVLNRYKIHIVHATNHTLQLWLLPCIFSQSKVVWNVRAQVDNTRRGRLRRDLYLRFCHGVIFVSKGVRPGVLSGGIRSNCKVAVIPNFVQDKFHQISRHAVFRVALNESRLVIGFIGRLNDPVKDVRRAVHIAVKALQLLPNCLKFRFCGDVSDLVLDSLLSIIPQELRADIEFLGQTQNPFEFYQTIDIILLTSRAEGFPRVLLESAACCVPSVAHDVGGVSEVVHDGVSGYLFHNDSQAVSAIQRLADDHELRTSMGHRAARFVGESYSIEQVIPKYLLFYKRLLKLCDSEVLC